VEASVLLYLRFMAPGAKIKTHIPLLPLLWVIFIHQKKGGNLDGRGDFLLGPRRGILTPAKQPDI
jgi:hypothetical protein